MTEFSTSLIDLNVEIPIAKGINIKRRHSINLSESFTSPVTPLSWSSLKLTPAVSFLKAFSASTENPHQDGMYERGDLIHRYIIVDLIGTGSFSKVYSAYSRIKNSANYAHFAIKVLSKPPLANSTEDASLSAIHHLNEEIKVWSRLKHPNIIRIHQVMETDEAIFVVSELAHTNLLTYLNKNGPITENSAKRLFKNLVSAVLYMHNNNTIHRDIKCENILLTLFNDMSFSNLVLDGDSSRNSMCANSPQLNQSSSAMNSPMQTIAENSTHTKSNESTDTNPATLTESKPPNITFIEPHQPFHFNEIITNTIETKEQPLSTFGIQKIKPQSETSSPYSGLSKIKELQRELDLQLEINLGDPYMPFYESEPLEIDIINTSTNSLDDYEFEPQQAEILNVSQSVLLIDIERYEFKLADFGLSVPIECEEIGEYTAGSIHYCSPEEIQQQSKPNPASDVWSLGCVLFAIISGSLPFNDEFLPRLQMSIISGKWDKSLIQFASNELNDLIERMLEVDVYKRITPKEILDHLWFNQD